MALIAAPFAAAAQALFRNELLYAASAPYATLSDAISSWDFSHDGRPLPDTIPDVAAAQARQPSLRVLSLAGYHDLATPFHQTELDLARLPSAASVVGRVYPGGHMIYLDDASRVRLKADLAAFVQGAPMAAQDASAVAAIATTPSTSGLGAQHERAASAGAPLGAPAPPAAAVPDRRALAQGGDPFLPPALRVAPHGASPRGAALAQLVRAKIAARDRDVYR